MKSFVLLVLLGQCLSVYVPPDNRSTLSETATTRSFTLPPFPPSEPTGITIPVITDRDAEPADVKEVKKRDGNVVFGTAPDPTQIQITAVTYGGTGCPSNSVGSAISSDRTIMTLIFDEYVASIGTGIAITESRKNCQLNLNLKYPGGFQYSILSADYRGYAYMDAGISGQQVSTYYFSGQTAQTSTGTSWVGPYNADYLIHDTAASASLIYSPCGTNAMLNINSQISLTSHNASGEGFLTTDSVDTSFTQEIYIMWQPCTS